MAVLDSTGLSNYEPPNEKPVASYNFLGLSIQGENSLINLTRVVGLEVKINDEFLWFDPELGLYLQGEEPHISLQDKDGNLRVALGTTRLKHTDTGSTEIRAPSSLVLFDEDGNVVWWAP